MKIAHLIHGLGLGGAQKVIASIVRNRLNDDYRYVVVSSSDGMHRAEIETAGGEVRVLQRLLPKLDPVWLLRLAGAMRSQGVDVVHAHLFGDSLHGYLAARLCRSLPVVLTLHNGPDGWSKLQSRAYPLLIRHCSRAVACSDSVRQAIEDSYPATRGMFTVIPNGIESPVLSVSRSGSRTSLRERYGIPGDAIVVATVGRLVEQKGLTHLVEAFSKLGQRLQGQEVRLLLIGDGHLRSELEEQVQREGLNGTVHFAGMLDGVPRLMPEIDIVVFSSLYEGLPIALLEAMATGRCLVCTDIPSLRSVVRPGKEALLVPPADSEGMASALELLVADHELRRKLGAAASCRFTDHFTAESMVRQYEALYQEVAE